MKMRILILLLIILVLVTPFAYSSNLYDGIITAKQIWFFGSIAFLTWVFSVNLFFRKKDLFYNINLIDISLLIFYLYLFTRAVFTHYTPLLYNDRFLNYSCLMVFYLIIRISGYHVASKNEVNFKISPTDQAIGAIRSYTDLLIFIMVVFGLIQAVWGLLQLYGITKSFNSSFKITGTFNNPAPYALYLSIIFPLALERYLQIRQIVKSEKPLQLFQLFFFINPKFNRVVTPLLLVKIAYYIFLSTIVAIILILPATMIRTSWLAVLIGTFIVFNSKYNLLNIAKEYLLSKIRMVLAFTLITTCIGISVIGLYFFKKGSTEGRLFIWEVTTHKVIEKPLFGYGVGRFEADYNNWQASYFQSHPNELNGSKGILAGNTIYCFNDYLEMAAELGVIGLFLFCSVIFSAILVIRRLNLNQTNDANTYNQNNTIYIPILVIVFSGTISFPFYSLPTLITFFFFLGILSCNVRSNSSPRGLFKTWEVNRFYRRLAFIVLFPFSIIIFVMTWQKHHALSAWEETKKLYVTENYPYIIKSFSNIHPFLQYNGSFLEQYGLILNLNKDYSHGILILERSRNFTSNQNLYISLGDTYKELNRPSEAIEAYLYASYIIPNMFYPKYLIAKFYLEIDQKENALKTAEEIINKKVKIESIAVDEMKMEMRELVAKLK